MLDKAHLTEWLESSSNAAWACPLRAHLRILLRRQEPSVPAPAQIPGQARIPGLNGMLVRMPAGPVRVPVPIQRPGRIPVREPIPVRALIQGWFPAPSAEPGTAAARSHP